MNYIVVNLFGGPGTGKSTTATGLFHKLKKQNEYLVEYIPEYAKELVWEERASLFSDQIKIFAEQYQRLENAFNYYYKHTPKNKKVVFVTDAPIIFPAIYEQLGDELFRKFVIKKFNEYNNFNIFLKRTKEFNPLGRVHSEQESIQIDKQIKQLFNDNNINFIEINEGDNSVDEIIDRINNYFGKYEPDFGDIFKLDLGKGEFYYLHLGIVETNEGIKSYFGLPLFTDIENSYYDLDIKFSSENSNLYYFNADRENFKYVYIPTDELYRKAPIDNIEKEGEFVDFLFDFIDNGGTSYIPLKYRGNKKTTQQTIICKQRNFPFEDYMYKS